MPQDYIRQAEIKLKERAIEILKESLEPKYSYNINVSDIFIANKDLYKDMLEGQKLHLVDEGLGIDEAILIETVSIKEGVRIIPEMKVTLNNEPTSSTKQAMKDQISKIDGSVTNNYAALDELNSLLRRKLDKDVWDRVWEIVTKDLGNNYVFGKMPVVTKYGVTMYGDKDDNTDHKDIYDGLPIDNITIKRRADGVLFSVGGGGGGGTLKDFTIIIGDKRYDSLGNTIELPALAESDWAKTQLDNKSDKSHTHSQYLTEHQSISHLATSKSLNDGLATKSDKAHTHSQYLTEHQSISHLATNEALNNAIATKDKQISDLNTSLSQANNEINSLNSKLIQANNEINAMKTRLSKLEAMWTDKGTYLHTTKSVVTDGSITMLKTK